MTPFAGLRTGHTQAFPPKTPFGITSPAIFIPINRDCRIPRGERIRNIYCWGKEKGILGCLRGNLYFRKELFFWGENGSGWSNYFFQLVENAVVSEYPSNGSNRLTGGVAL
jgi:hypothetical protein